MAMRKIREDHEDTRRRCWGCRFLSGETWPDRSINYYCNRTKAELRGTLSVFGTLVEPREMKAGCHEA